MANALTLAACLDAGHLRLAQLGEALLRALDLDNEPEVERLTTTTLHLRLALEDAARHPAGSAKQAAVLGYLTETYGLAEALTDPLLRSTLPAVPTAGAKVRPLVLSMNGKLLLVNAAAVAVGARLTPASPQ